MWRVKLAKENINIKSGIDGLAICNKELYSNIHFLYKIVCTLSMSTSTPEPTFSCLKRLKTYLRNSMKDVSIFPIGTNEIFVVFINCLNFKYYFNFRPG